MKIGIIGVGFVGRAILEAYKETESTVVCRDPAVGHNTSIEEIKTTDAVFVCVPSPPLNDGRCDISILESVLADLKDYTGVIISKVTAPPNEYTRLNKLYPQLVYSPEFLTAANAVEDYKNSKFVILGGDQEMCQRAFGAILIGLGMVTAKFTDIASASLAKYTINCFLATKVAFMNEVYDVACASGIDYNGLVDLVTLDQRIGSSHMRVPGTDGRGFGGACFPKDTRALVHYAHRIGEDMTILEQAITSNKLNRMK